MESKKVFFRGSPVFFFCNGSALSSVIFDGILWYCGQRTTEVEKTSVIFLLGFFDIVDSELCRLMATPY